MYAKWSNGILDISLTEKPGYKPMVRTDEPVPPAGYHTSFFWKETEQEWVQTWEFVIDEEDE